MDIKKEIKKYTSFLSKVLTHFGMQALGAIDDLTNVWWYYNGKKLYDIHFAYEEPKNKTPESQELNYSLQVLFSISKDGYTVAKIDDGCGSVYAILLDDEKRIQ